MVWDHLWLLETFVEGTDLVKKGYLQSTAHERTHRNEKPAHHNEE